MEHGRYIADFAQGKFYKNIEKDPRDNMHPDEKLDLKTVPGYKGFSRQKTTIADDSVNVRPVKQGVEKYIKIMKEIA